MAKGAKRSKTSKRKTKRKSTATAKKRKTSRRTAMAEFGICYDNPGCQAGDESAWSVEYNACKASGGKSWKGPVSGCKAIP